MFKLKYMVVLSILLGFTLGIAVTSRARAAGTGYTIVVTMTPPTLVSGSYATLNCGWHLACVNPYTYSTGLDFEDGNTGYNNPWYFRGYFATGNPAGGVVATGTPLVNQSGADVCDRMTVWIIEKYNGVLRAAPLYVHTKITNSTVFDIGGSLFGTYFNRQIGATIDDAGLNCSFTGSHVHEDHVSVNGGVTTTLHSSLYPSATTCNNSCGLFFNSTQNGWTRKFSWPEGG